MRRLLIVALALLLPAAAAGVDIQTTILNDVPDANVGDGICDVDPDTPLEQCTLRAAVQTANFLPGPDRILLRGSVSYELSLAGAGEDGDLDVTSEIEIVGKGYQSSFIDAKKLKDRIFDVAPGGDLTLTKTALLNGRTAKDDFDPGAPGEVSGGCLRSAGESSLSEVFFFGCSSSDDGGCVSVIDGDTDVSSSIFHTCRAKNEGGAVEVTALGEATLAHVAAGLCRAGTGAVVAARGPLDLSNATLSGNKAKLGGAVAVLGGAAATIRSSTITDNGSVNLDASQGTMTVSNTIVSDAKTDCLGAVTSAGGNLESATSCGFTATNDQQSQDPLLFAFAFNGGLVPTRALGPTSPAVDHGIDGATCETTDARGVARIDHPIADLAICDAGAFELQPPPAP